MLVSVLVTAAIARHHAHMALESLELQSGHVALTDLFLQPPDERRMKIVCGRHFSQYRTWKAGEIGTGCQAKLWAHWRANAHAMEHFTVHLTKTLNANRCLYDPLL